MTSLSYDKMLHFINLVVCMVAITVATVNNGVYDYINRNKHMLDLQNSVATIFNEAARFVSKLTR